MPRPASTSPTCPAQILKVGVEHWLTPERGAPSWSPPATWCCSETRANRNARLPGYATLAVHTSFDVTKRVQLTPSSTMFSTGILRLTYPSGGPKVRY